MSTFGKTNTETVQTALHTLFLYQGDIDGSYGPNTIRAVLKFQTTCGLEQTGVANSSTLKELRAATFNFTAEEIMQLPLSSMQLALAVGTERAAEMEAAYQESYTDVQTTSTAGEALLEGATRTFDVLMGFAVGLGKAFLDSQVIPKTMVLDLIITICTQSPVYQNAVTSTYMQTADSAIDYLSTHFTYQSSFYFGKCLADVALMGLGVGAAVAGIKQIIAGIFTGAGGGALGSAMVATGGGAAIGVATIGAAAAAADALIATGNLTIAAGLSLFAAGASGLPGDIDKYNAAKETECQKSDSTGPNSSFKKYSADEIEKKYGLKKGQYHREVKPDILADLTKNNSPYKSDMSTVGKNPDIYLSADGKIQIVATNGSGKSFATDWYITEFLP